MAPTPSAALPFAASLLSIVANLEGLDLEGLRRQWRAHLGGKAPAHLSRWLCHIAVRRVAKIRASRNN
jgi:hypothetical protein